jgi:hypothetical protein
MRNVVETVRIVLKSVSFVPRRTRLILDRRRLPGDNAS